MKNFILQILCCFAIALFIISFIACILMSIQMFVYKYDYSPFIVLFVAIGIFSLAIIVFCSYFFKNETKRTKHNKVVCKNCGYIDKITYFPYKSSYDPQDNPAYEVDPTYYHILICPKCGSSKLKFKKKSKEIKNATH